MTVPQWSLLGFAVWTLLVLFGTIGVYRWSRILTGRVAICEWQADLPQGNEWYRRAMRAHANCIENLPVFGAIVFCVTVADAQSSVLDLLAVGVVFGRICQTTVHVALVQSNFVVCVRFAFYFVQVVCMFAMAFTAAVSAVPS